jgi:hypothetical protein
MEDTYTFIDQLKELIQKNIPISLHTIKLKDRPFIQILEDGNYQLSKLAISKLIFLRNKYFENRKVVEILDNLIKEIFVVFVDQL